jgi:hypothetical protein
VWKLYVAVTTALGSNRRLIRRLAALCLVFMGVHAAADHLDDIVYKVLDALDLVADETAAGVMAWLAEHGGMTPEGALSKTEAFASFIDLAQKDRLAIVLALVVELLLDVLLLDFAWGRHQDGESTGFFAELKDSAIQVLAALRPLDLERVGVLPTVMLYAFGGSVSAALAVERLTRDLLARVAPELLWGGAVAASVGILASALLCWRFLPDLLHGALLRSRVRGETARDRVLKALEAKAGRRFPRLARTFAFTRLALRGWWLVLLALPLAFAGVASEDLLGLIARATPTPGDSL